MAETRFRRRRIAAHTFAGLAAVATAFVEPTVRAQANLSLAATVGGGLADVGRTGGPSPLFHLGARGDLLLLRRRDADMALGPYVDVATAGFKTADIGAGLEWLLPVTEHLPVIVSAGGFGRTGCASGWEPGAVATIFAGSKSLNFNSLYGLGAGLFLQGRLGFGDVRAAELIFGAHLDFAILSLPFVLIANAIRTS